MGTNKNYDIIVIIASILNTYLFLLGFVYFHQIAT